jgi:myo-inositol-1(or 4)-monophosphatase
MTERKKGQCLRYFLEVAVKAALAAGEYLCRQIHRTRQVDYKGVVNLVTDCDRQSQKIILSVIGQAFPDHGFLAEENGHRVTGREEYCWLIDPLDGTTNYAHGLPIFCVSIALEKEGELLVGVVYDPMRQELFQAIKGQGARLNGRRLKVSQTSSLNLSLLATGFPYDLRKSPVNNLVHFENFLFRVQAIRLCGAAALDLAYVACGRFDGFWELKLNPWDVAAGSLLVEEAGGRVTDFKGTKIDLAAGEIVASNGLIHASMLKILRMGLKK